VELLHLVREITVVPVWQARRHSEAVVVAALVRLE
jgi:hypothetical protein